MRPFTALKMVTFAAMPTARVSTAVNANPGLLRNCLRAKRRSCMSPLIFSSFALESYHAIDLGRTSRRDNTLPLAKPELPKSPPAPSFANRTQQSLHEVFAVVLSSTQFRLPSFQACSRSWLMFIAPTPCSILAQRGVCSWKQQHLQSQR